VHETFFFIIRYGFSTAIIYRANQQGEYVN